MKDIIRKLFSSRNKKKTIGIICGVVAIIILIVLVIINPFGNTEAKRQKQLENRFKEIAKDYYENRYYNTVGKDDEARKSFVKEYAKHGIIMDLENIARANPEEEKNILNEFDGCDSHESLVYIYPKEPYGATNYSVDVKLVCDFSKKSSSNKDDKKDETTTTKTTTTKATTTTKKKK